MMKLYNVPMSKTFQIQSFSVNIIYLIILNIGNIYFLYCTDLFGYDIQGEILILIIPEYIIP